MAEVVLRAQLSKAGLDGRVVVDSAGTGDWHVTERMHRPARNELARRGYDGSAHRARQVDPRWLAERDLLLAMDPSNLATLRALARRAGPAGQRADDDGRIRLFGEAAGLDGAGVPDPYGGSQQDFARVLDMLEAGTGRLVGRLRAVVEAPASER